MALKIRELCFKYKNTDSFVINKLNLDLENGECIAVNGNNGSGKSTLISILSGIIPDFTDGELKGEISYDENSHIKPSCVLQDLDSQILCESIKEEISFFLHYSNGNNTNQSAEEISENVGLDKIINRKVYQLSSGEKQRLALGCATACGNKKLILLDESCAYLDSDGFKRLIKILKSLKENGSSILITGHSFSNLEGLIDKSFHLSDGKLVQPQNIICNKTSPKTEKYPAPVSAQEKLISIRNLNFCADNKEIIFSDFNCDIFRGAIYGLTGANGSGKSTIAKILSGIEECANGKILFNNLKADQKILRNNVKLITQNPFNQLLYKTVSENINSAYRTRTAEPVIKCSEGIKILKLENLLKRDISTLSFGQAQRTAMLAAVLQSPELLIIDESFSCLDREGIESFCSLMFKLKSAQKSVLIISHLENLIFDICDNIIHLKQHLNYALSK